MLQDVGVATAAAVSAALCASQNMYVAVKEAFDCGRQASELVAACSDSEYHVVQQEVATAVQRATQAVTRRFNIQLRNQMTVVITPVIKLLLPDIAIDAADRDANDHVSGVVGSEIGPGNRYVLDRATGTQLWRIFSCYALRGSPDDIDHVTEYEFLQFLLDCQLLRAGIDSQLPIVRGVRVRSDQERNAGLLSAAEGHSGCGVAPRITCPCVLSWWGAGGSKGFFLATTAQRRMLAVGWHMCNKWRGATRGHVAQAMCSSVLPLALARW